MIFYAFPLLSRGDENQGAFNAEASLKTHAPFHVSSPNAPLRLMG